MKKLINQKKKQKKKRNKINPGSVTDSTDKIEVNKVSISSLGLNRRG